MNLGTGDLMRQPFGGVEGIETRLKRGWEKCNAEKRMQSSLSKKSDDMMKRDVMIMQTAVGSLTVSYSYFPYNFNIEKN